MFHSFLARMRVFRVFVREKRNWPIFNIDSITPIFVQFLLYLNQLALYSQESTKNNIDKYL